MKKILILTIAIALLAVGCGGESSLEDRGYTKISGEVFFNTSSTDIYISEPKDLPSYTEEFSRKLYRILFADEKLESAGGIIITDSEGNPRSVDWYINNPDDESGVSIFAAINKAGKLEGDTKIRYPMPDTRISPFLDGDGFNPFTHMNGPIYLLLHRDIPYQLSEQGIEYNGQINDISFIDLKHRTITLSVPMSEEMVGTFLDNAQNLLSQYNDKK